MKTYIKGDEWNIIEEGFHPQFNKISESIFSLGNGRFGQRGNFEEHYSGETLQGNYIAGIYYPDKTKVGWWKNGYPEYFAKVLNAINWLDLDITIGTERLDLATCEVRSFKRILHMKEGYLERSFTARFPSGKELLVNARRFCSIANDKTGAICYAITPLNFNSPVTVKLGIDGNVENQDSNYGERFWLEDDHKFDAGSAVMRFLTKKTFFKIDISFCYKMYVNEQEVHLEEKTIKKEKYIGYQVTIDGKMQQEIVINKYVAIVHVDESHDKPQVSSEHILKDIQNCDFEDLLKDHAASWSEKWKQSDIKIEGDVAAQQAIRFNIFQLNQTYTGEDANLNIGPKGFTGEKYGGSTYWDTEAYCIPFYLGTADQKVARNLLLYRYHHLGKAIENAEKLGFTKGAALYPMVTMNGEECHNEWEITFEEIHRNGAIAYAIYNYVRYTGDESYLSSYGLEVLIAISRFWEQRVNWSEEKQKYVILGVTGPNEYENNVNNNWYTNLMASWCLNYTVEVLKLVSKQNPNQLLSLLTKINFKEEQEVAKWQHIIRHMYFPEDKKQGIFLQQDGYLDKEQVLVKDLDPENLPLNQKWSWDRILRSVFIKQADVLQGIYLFEDDFDQACLRRNFDYYEARTVHESSLSSCVHAILAARLKYADRAYHLYLRTARLDLDDYNNDTEDGLHITSMAGTWMSIVEGFAGMRVRNNQLYFSPLLPMQWKSYSFSINFRGIILTVRITEKGIEIINQSESQNITIQVLESEYTIHSNSVVVIEHLVVN